MEPENQKKNRAITWRSVLVGLLLSVLIVCITPYNDYVVWNSFIVGSYFPVIATLSMLAIVLLINGPLHKFAPRLALSPGELAIIMVMMLVSCSIPSQGLLRQFVPLPVAPMNLSGTSPAYHDLLSKMDLPKWLFPVKDPENGYKEMSVTRFYTRLAHDETIDWSLWVKPIIGWGVFAIGFFISMLAIACLVRFQWAVNERLAFPIAQLQSLLIAPPAPGKAFNDIFSKKGFWIAAILVIVIQGSEAMHEYFPKGIPAILTRYDMKPVLSDPPWSYLPDWIRASSIMFTIIGVSYFIRTRVSFSLWGTALLIALIKWPMAIAGDTTTLGDAALWDQSLGASFAFMAGILWVGRQHWMVILRAFFGVARPGDARGQFVAYRWATLSLLLGIGVMFGWLMFMHCSAWMSIVCVVMILMAHIITARIVAETGLTYFRMPVDMDQILRNIPAAWMTPRDGFFYGMSHYVYMQAARESILPFTLNSLEIINEAGISDQEKRRIIPLFSTTLIVSAIAGIIAALYCYYHWAVPLDQTNKDGILNVFGLQTWPNSWLNEWPTQIKNGQLAPKTMHPWINMAVGLVIMMFLQMMTWRFAAWPLLPVGYLLCTCRSSYYVTTAALSLFLGWLAKTLILRFGGSKLFNDLKPVFIGLIFGEALSVGIWLIVTLILAMMGEEFHVVRFMPQ